MDTEKEGFMHLLELPNVQNVDGLTITIVQKKGHGVTLKIVGLKVLPILYMPEEHCFLMIVR